MDVQNVGSETKTREDEERMKRNVVGQQQGGTVDQQQVAKNENTVEAIRADNTQVAQANAVQGPQPTSDTDEQKKILT